VFGKQDASSLELFIPTRTLNTSTTTSTQATTMTRVLLTGGSGFIAAHTLDILLEHGHSVVTTVRTQEKADKIKASYQSYADKGQLDFAIVPDIAQPDAFEKAVVSDPPFEAVLHTASPFTFDISDIQKVSVTSFHNQRQN
jgi:nucleoside-diphosphate-sugar epimerase